MWNEFRDDFDNHWDREDHNARDIEREPDLHRDAFQRPRNAACSIESHAAVQKDPEQFAKLARPRMWEVAPGYVLEMRDCHCGSSLSVEVETDGAEDAS